MSLLDVVTLTGPSYLDSYNADCPSHAITISPSVILYFVQSDCVCNRVARIPANSLRYAVCDYGGPGTVLTEMMLFSSSNPSKIVADVPLLFLYEPSLTALAFLRQMASATSLPSSVVDTF